MWVYVPKVRTGILPGKNRHIYADLCIVVLRYGLEFYQVKTSAFMWVYEC